MNQDTIHDYNINSWGTQYQNFIIDFVEKDRGHLILNSFNFFAGRTIGILKPIARLRDIFKHTVLAASHLVGGLTLTPLHLLAWKCLGRNANPTFHASYTCTHLAFTIQFLADGIFSFFSNILDPRILKTDNRDLLELSRTHQEISTAQLTQYNTSQTALAATQSQLRTAEAKLESLESQLQTALEENSHCAPGLGDRLIDANDQFTLAKEQLKGLSLAIKSKHQEIQNLTNQLSRLRAEHNTLVETNQNNLRTIEIIQAQLQTERENLRDLRADLEVANLTLEHAEKTIIETQEKGEKELIAANELNFSQIRILENQIDEFRLEIAELTRQLESPQSISRSSHTPLTNRAIPPTPLPRDRPITQPLSDSQQLPDESLNVTFDEFDINDLPTEENDKEPELVFSATQNLFEEIRTYQKKASDTPVPCSTIKPECQEILKEAEVENYLYDLHYEEGERDLFNGYLNYFYTQYYVVEDKKIPQYVWNQNEIPTDHNGDIIITPHVGVTIRKKLQRIKNACEGLITGKVLKHGEILGSVVSVRRQDVNASKEDLIKLDARKFLCICRSIACIRKYLKTFKSHAEVADEHMRKLNADRAAAASSSSAANEEKIQRLKTCANEFEKFIKQSPALVAEFKTLCKDQKFARDIEDHEYEGYVRTLYQYKWPKTSIDISLELKKLEAALNS